MEVNALPRLVLTVVLSTGSAPGARPASDAVVIKRVAVLSSTIASVGYSRDARVLEVEFRTGAIYRYRAVPESVFKGMSSATSKGRFFGAEIRGKFPYEKVREVPR